MTKENIEQLVEDLKLEVIENKDKRSNELIELLEDRHSLLDEEKELIDATLHNVAVDAVLNVVKSIDKLM